MIEESTIAEYAAIVKSVPRDKLFQELLPPALLALYTLLTRLLCSSALFFADGPAHVKAILAKVYIIQPPGYWLFNRVAGFFPDPASAIAGMNILFSVAGVVTLYFTALIFTKRWNAFLAALAYANIFYLWFSGEVHSTYASQILFPVWLFYTLIRYERERKGWLLFLSALVFAVGAGLRPSDGIFLFPMVLYFAISRLSWKTSASYLVLVFVLCLSWVIPTAVAFDESKSGTYSAFHYVASIIRVRSILTGVNSGTIANVVRYVLPLLAAFWLLLPTIALKILHDRKEWHVRMLLFWLIPGSLFLTLIYIADAPYLNFLTACFLLLALMAPRRLALTAVCNLAVFLFFSPIPTHHLAINVWNCDIGKYTRFSLQHQWQPNLSDVQSSGLQVR